MNSLTVEPEVAGATIPWSDKTAADMQTGLTVSGKSITGTLHFIEGGVAPSGPLAGDGYFMFLKFADAPEGTTVRVGLNPTYGTGPVELDSDMNGVFKVANGAQKFEVLYGTGADIRKDVYDLSGLIFESTDA